MNIKKKIGYLLILAGVSYFFMKHTIKWDDLISFEWSSKIIMGILGACLMLAVRDLGYVLRLKLMTNNQMKFWQTVKIVLLWEFGSAITPAMLGGKAVALYLLIQAKVRAAHASAVVLMAILLDELVFLLIFPILYLMYGRKMFEVHTECQDWISLKSKLSFLSNIEYIETMVWIMIGVLSVVVGVIMMGVFIRPQWIYNKLKWLSRRPKLSIWSQKIASFADDMNEINAFFSNQSIYFWFRLIGYTLMSWLGRYFVAVMILWGFGNLEVMPLGLIYAKQYSLWFMFYLPSTPGSSGIAEAIFIAFYCPYIAVGHSGIAALIWRMISYYVYVLIGVISMLFPSRRGE